MSGLIKYENDLFTLTNSIFDNFFNNSHKMELGKVNIIENVDNYILNVIATGLNKDDVDISISDGYIEIAANAKNENEQVDKNFVRREFNHISFKRFFKLPNDADFENINAEITNGILNINIPKHGEKNEKLKIDIK